MKLSGLRATFCASKDAYLRWDGDGAELLADIDAEIAKAREGRAVSNIDRRVSSLAGGLDDVERRLAALEASEVELREHCQGNVPMSVFNDLKERVDSLSSDASSLENATTRELRALAERVSRLGEDDAYKAWRREPWPEDVVKGGPGVQLEEAFRSGFRAGRK